MLKQLYHIGRRCVLNAYAWITISAVLLTIPLHFSTYGCWLVFVGHIPLFYAVLTSHCTVYHGLWWGLLCWTGQLYALFFAVHEHGCGELRILVPVFLILYCAAYSVLLFYIAQRLSNKKKMPMRACMWVIGVTGYYLIMRYTILWIIGLSTGYPLALPLLPLAEYPPFLFFLPYISSAGLLTCLLMFSMSVAYYWTTNKRPVLVISACALFPFCIGWFIQQEGEKSALLPVCAAVIPPLSPGVMHPRDHAQSINERITDILTHRPTVQIIIMPESSYPFALNTHEDVINVWSVNALHKGQLLVIGSYWQEGGNLYNGIYGIKECRIIFNYVKNCRMPFTEYVPFPWSMVTCTRTLFLKNKQGFSSKKLCPVIPLADNYWVQPALCSEFFFEAYDSTLQLPILALINDSWFSCPYIKRLMYLFARYTALSRSRDIIYSSYTHGVFIDKQGRERQL